MSTNGVYGQMQSWLNGHGKNVSDFSSKMDEFEKQFYEIFQQYQEKLTNKEYNELNEKFADLQMNYLEAELNYLKQEKEVGRSFNFMEGDYDITDGQTFIPAYVEQTGKLAQGDMDSWETDGEDGISLEEYKSSQLGSADASQLGEEGYNAAVSYAEEVFNTIDIDGDGIIEKNELQGFYAAMDNVDGSVDGKISVDSLGVDYTSEKFRKNIEEFQQYLQ